MNNRRIIIHPGLPKTATTAIQREILQNTKGIRNIGKPYSKLAKELDEIAYDDEISFDFESVKSKIYNTLEQDSDNLTVVISYEGLSFAPEAERGRTVKRLKKLFPEAKILITIREQRKMLGSLYTHQLKKMLQHGDYKSFKSWGASQLKAKGSASIDNVFYGKLIDEYSEHFGKDNLSIIPVELLKKKPAEFTGKLSESLGINQETIKELIENMGQQNESISKLKYYVQKYYILIAPIFIRKLLNAILPAKMKLFVRDSLEVGPKHKEAVPEKLNKTLEPKFAEINTRLEREYCLELADLGYITKSDLK